MNQIKIAAVAAAGLVGIAFFFLQPGNSCSRVLSPEHTERSWDDITQNPPRTGQVNTAAFVVGGGNCPLPADLDGLSCEGEYMVLAARPGQAVDFSKPTTESGQVIVTTASRNQFADQMRYLVTLSFGAVSQQGVVQSALTDCAPSP